MTSLQCSIISSITTTKAGDSKYIGDLLTIVFGRETLLKSSPSGLTANNSVVQMLDAKKLEFVKGN